MSSGKDGSRLDPTEYRDEPARSRTGETEPLVAAKHNRGFYHDRPTIKSTADLHQNSRLAVELHAEPGPEHFRHIFAPRDCGLARLTFYVRPSAHLPRRLRQENVIDCDFLTTVGSLSRHHDKEAAPSSISCDRACRIRPATLISPWPANPLRTADRTACPIRTVATQSENRLARALRELCGRSIRMSLSCQGKMFSPLPLVLKVTG